MARLLQRFSKQQLPLGAFLSKEPFSELLSYAQTPRPEWTVLGEVVNGRLHHAPVEDLAPLLKIFAYKAVHSLDWKKMCIAAEWDVSKASPRAVVALALCFARVDSRVGERPRDLFVALGKRVLEFEQNAEAWEARDLAHITFAFGKVKVYHHRLFKFLEQALIDKQHELKAEEAVQASFGFARCLPADFHEMSPAKQERNGFPKLLAAMRLQWLRRMGMEKANHPTAILLLNTLAILRWRDDVILEKIMPVIDVHRASEQDLVYLCGALGKLDAWRFVSEDVVLAVLKILAKQKNLTAASSMSCSALMYPCALMGYSTRLLWADVAAKHCLRDKKAQPWTTTWHYYVYFHFFPFSSFPLPHSGGELHRASPSSPSELHTHVASVIPRTCVVKHEVPVGPFVLDMVVNNYN